MSEKLTIHCNNCDNITFHTLCAKEKVYGKDDHHPISWSNSIEILKCDGCYSLCARHISWHSEDCRADGEPIERIVYYPRRTDTYIEPEIIDNLPLIVQRTYNEAIKSYNTGLKLSCSSMLRATLDAICKDKKIECGEVIKNGVTLIKGNLEGKINGLCMHGYITEDQANFLHETRFLGNEALHEFEIATSLELLAAIEIIEHMLISIYELKDRATVLSMRRKKNEQLKNKNNAND